MIILFISVSYIKTSNFFHLKYFYFAGLLFFLIWTGCVAGYISIDFFEKFLLSGYQSFQLAGINRFYSIFTISFVLLPIPERNKSLYTIIGFLVTFSTLSVAIIGLYVLKILFLKRGKLLPRLVYILLISLATIVFLKLNNISDLVVDQKIHSLDARLSKIMVPNLFKTLYFNGQEDFSESMLLSYSYFWGLVPALIFFSYFFVVIRKRSASSLYMFISSMILLVNPFPLSLIYLYSNLSTKHHEIAK